MSSDQILVLGLVLGVFSVPAIFSALSDRRSPRVAAFVIIAAGCLVIWAFNKKPGGYAIRDIPQAFVQVVADIIR